MFKPSTPYFRPHSCKWCFQTGSVIDGELDWKTTGESSKCPFNVHTRTWFKLSIIVSQEKAQIWIDDKLLKAEQKTLLPSQARGGILVPNGYNNIVYFKNFQITPIERD